MPNISSIPVREYQPNWDYNYYYDNIPIGDIETQLSVINNQVDLNRNAISDSVGTAGSLAARLNVSLNDDGSLSATAVNNTNHNIADHSADPNNVYVLMTYLEQAKLAGIPANANQLHIAMPSDAQIWPDNVGTTLQLQNSDTITWRYEDGTGSDPQGLYADDIVANWVANGIWYNVPITGSGTNFTTPSHVSYISGTLRVYINGLRIGNNILYPVNGYYFTEGVATDGVVLGGDFELNTSLSGVMYIDFNRPFS